MITPMIKMLPSIGSIISKPNIVIIVFVLLIVNIPFIVTQNGDKIILNKKSQDQAVPSKSYEEFYIEHAISKKQAKQNFHDNYKTLMQGKWKKNTQRKKHQRFDCSLLWIVMHSYRYDQIVIYIFAKKSRKVAIVVYGMYARYHPLLSEWNA